jgi:catechol 2,3-dioxygenase-like lactoylglutathione lyase family enzyme
VLLLFQRGTSGQPISIPGGTIPPHDGRGTEHLGFQIATDNLHAWENWLARRQVAIESRVTWERGGTSLYFRDPDGHLLELLTPGVWEVY